MLSPEERRGMLEEAADPRRRDVLRAARVSARSVVTPEALLAFLTGAGALLAGFAALPRPVPRAGGRYLL